MKPVFQDRYGIGRGNCVTACVASILECEIADLPEFCDGEGPEWFDRLYDYCHRNGMFLIHWKHDESVPLICCDAYVIMEVSLEGITTENHAIVGKTYRECTSIRSDGSKVWQWATEIVHDPSLAPAPPIDKVLSYTMIGPRTTSLKN